MLYQPTNIYPSMTGALGNGVIDANNDLVVSWQVNGNSPMTAFQITIYANNTTSTQLFSTGKLTYGCPFYGVDYAGNTQFFHYTIFQGQLSFAGIVNGRGYKLVIQQWWNDSDSVTQSSASVFHARTSPTLSIGEVPKPLASRSFTFTADYRQEQGDSLNWCRWEITDASSGTELTDTGKIYGTSQLMFKYDGFLNGRTYRVVCSAQTESGVEVSSNTLVSVQYTTKPIQGNITVCQSNKGNGVKITLPEVNNVPGESSGSVEIRDSYLTLYSNENAAVKWTAKNGEPLSIQQPFDLCWKGKETPDGDILSIDVKASVPGFEPTKVIETPTESPFGSHGAACVCSGTAYPTYVIITSNGTVSYSTDLENWNHAQIGSASQDYGWCGLAYGNSTYCAVSWDGKRTARSSNLTSWTTETVNTRLSSVCYGAGEFVAVGEGAVLTKGTSISASWTKITVPFTSEPTAVAYGTTGNAKYVVGTVAGEIYRSADGATWTLAASGLGRISSISYYAGKFYATLMYDSGILASSDGTTWEVIANIQEFYNGVSSICDAYGVLYAVGYLTGNYAYSIDYGKTWAVFPCSAITNAAFVFPSTNSAFLVGNGMDDNIPFIYAGKSTNVTQNATITTSLSANIDFDILENVMPAASRWSDVCYGGGKFVAVSYNSNTAAYSTTGSEWFSSTLHESEDYWQSVCYGNGLFVAAGTQNFATSTDAETWTTRTAPLNNVSSVRFLNGYFYAVGTGIYRSPDGVSWSKCNISEYTGYPIMSIDYGNNMYVCVTSSRAVYSYDGVNWSYADMPNYSWRCVCFGNGVFVAAGLTNGYITYSTDGKTWSLAQLPSGNVMLHGVCFGSGRFIAAAYNNVEISVDGRSWNVAHAGNVFDACCFGNDNFVAVGDTASILRSGTALIDINTSMNGMQFPSGSMPSVQQWLFRIDGTKNKIETFWTVDGQTTAGEFSNYIPPISEITSVTAGGVGSTDFIFASDGHISDENKNKFEDWENPYHPYDLNNQFYADFTSDLNGDSAFGNYFSQFAVYRMTDDAPTATHIFDSSASGGRSFIDVSAVNNVNYQYSAFGISDFDQSSVITSDSVKICVWNWTVFSCTKDAQGVYHPQKIFSFGKNLSSGDISNNNAPQILQNFTRYPTVQPSPFNYKSGTLTSLIGTISNGVYSDTITDRDEIMGLSTTQNTLFLKSRKGDLLKIRVGGAIEFGTMDNSPTQAQTVTIPWVEVGDASTARIIITRNDGAWPI